MIISLNSRELLLLLVIPILFSCIGENCSTCSQESNYKEQYRVNFLGNYAITKSASVFPAGVETSIFTYYSGEDPSLKKEHLDTPLKAISNLSGNLILANNFALYLAPGYYDFYAVSTNYSSLNGLSFTMGQSNSLKNGVDYLWAQSRDITICGHSNIKFNFVHVAAAIIIELNTQTYSKAHLEQASLSRATIGIPTTNQILKLATGKITPAKSTSALRAEMFTNNNKASYIILPLKENVDIPIELDITTISNSNQESKERYYCTLPSPPNGFQGGVQYRYRTSISQKKIVFENAAVEQWNQKEIANTTLSEKK
ncbi:MAG: fimbrillin family protein [Bacteroidales bacterium]